MDCQLLGWGVWQGQEKVKYQGTEDMAVDTHFPR
jgi:hypothetical protein